MLSHKTYTTKLWKKCIFRKPGGSSIKACFINLPKHRTEEFVDFQMKYYVKEEYTHQISGLSFSKAAMAEYRQWFRNQIISPSCHNVVCCLKDKNNNLTEIISAYSVKIVNQTDGCLDDNPANFINKNVKNFFEILRKWNDLFPVPELMKKYNLQRYLDDQGFSVHPDYYEYGVAKEVGTLSRLMCIDLGIEMAGAWLTSIGTQKAATRAGWETVYEISREELEKILNMKLKSPPPSHKYMIKF